EYIDKMKAGWIGQMVGVGWGGPTEFQWQREIIPADKVPNWSPEMVNQYGQDDIYVEMTFLRTLELYGFDVDIRQAGIDFANSRYMLWHANKAGRDNLRAGIAPPFSGHPQFNAHADDIDYQIEADYSGLIAPGLPQAAVDLGEIFGRLMNYGDGLYGGQFVAGMYAAAFFESDPEKIVRAGLECIPSGSLYYQTITDVLTWYKENPNDWKHTWNLIEAKYQDNPDNRRFSCSGPADKFNIDAKINGAYIVMGLLYGKGDPDSTIVISMRCGQDSDCNPSNAAGVLFTTFGFSRLPERYISALDTVPKFSYTDYSFGSLVRVCEQLARQAVVRYGGKIEKDSNGKEWFIIPKKPVKPSPLEQCWSPAAVSGEVKFTTEEMAKIHFRPRRKEDYIRVWQVSGPFMKSGMDATALFDVAFSPETGAGSWKSLPEGSFDPTEIDLAKLFGKTQCVVYLRTAINAPEDRDAVLELGSDDGIKVWLNGQLVHAANVQRGHTAGEDKVPVRLKKGKSPRALGAGPYRQLLPISREM
ncbi:MAG: ADP-ribosylglycohydrolase family protein, partial [candidate division KSB1 bacterium]|nr:ADP-ribosylglycohydrolase family protein [candidate division KSB1 bacterium]